GSTRSARWTARRGARERCSFDGASTRPLAKERLVQIECATGDRLPRILPLCRRARGGGHGHQRGAVAEQLLQRAAQRGGISRGHGARGAGGSDLGEATDVAEQQRLSKRERREQHT